VKYLPLYFKNYKPTILSTLLILKAHYWMQIWASSNHLPSSQLILLQTMSTLPSHHLLSLPCTFPIKTICEFVGFEVFTAMIHDHQDHNAMQCCGTFHWQLGQLGPLKHQYPTTSLYGIKTLKTMAWMCEFFFPISAASPGYILSNKS